MIRIDMSEYQEKHTVSRLIGAPPGYVGYEEAGQLTEAVRRRPYAVVLFDEIEKAHPEVLNVMLQLLDDGRLTDGKGRTVDFKNTVVIMTSNVGSHFIAEAAMQAGLEATAAGSQTSYGLDEGIRREVMDALRAHFRPEFLNRVDEIIIFHALTREQMRAIIDIQLRGLMKRLEDRKIRVELTDRAKDLLIAEGYDPTYGARPLKRDPAAARARPAGDARAAGRLPRRRRDPHRRAARRAGVHARRPGSPGLRVRTRLKPDAAGTRAIGTGSDRYMADETPGKPPLKRPQADAADRARRRDVVRPRAVAPARRSAQAFFLSIAVGRDDLLQRVQAGRPRGAGPGGHRRRRPRPRDAQGRHAGEAAPSPPSGSRIPSSSRTSSSTA